MFYNFIRRRWIYSFLTFDNFFLTISFFMSHSRLHYLNPLPLSSLSQPYPLSALNTLHSILSPQTIVNEKRAPTITVDALPLVPAGTNLILLN